MKKYSYFVQISFIGRMNTIIVVHSFNGIYFGNKKNELPICTTLKNHKNAMLREQIDKKEDKLNGSIFLMLTNK